MSYIKNILFYSKPELAKEWHPSKNGNLTPKDVTCGSNKKVWWKCDKGHEWQVRINSRSRNNSKCPFCSGRYAIKGVTDLGTVNPELAKEWHPTKNGELTPKDVTCGSNKKVWWICKKGHEWQASVSNRNRNNSCPCCSGKKVCKDNCLASKNPELAKEWHPTKNGELTPKDVTCGSNKKVWWKCKKGHEWQATVSNRNTKGCPYCAGQKVCHDNCLLTLNPKLAKEWHPSKNGNLTSKDVTSNSGKKVWWKCSKGHEWQAVIYSRNSNVNCPYCSNKIAYEDNCLEAINSELAKEWHPSKNGNLTPKDVTCGSNKKVWWKCKKGHEWQAIVNSRHGRNSKCPYCTNQKVCKDNCLEVINSKLAKEWHPSKNGKLTPKDVTANSKQKVWWLCEKGHEWKTQVSSRNFGTNCPVCQEGRHTSFREKSIYFYISRIFEDAKSNYTINVGNTKSEVDIYIPSIKVGIEYDGYYWHKDKKDIDQNKNKLLCKDIYLIRIRENGLPSLDECENIIEYSLNSDSKNDMNLAIRFILNCIKNNMRKIDNNLAEKIDSICIDINKDEIEILNLINNIEQKESLGTLRPDIAGKWHPTKNGKLTPYHVKCGSGKKVWWVCENGHEYRSEIISRVKGHGCPYCTNKKASLENSLAIKRPNVASEWNYEKNNESRPEEFLCSSNKKVWWICNSGHEWKASISDRNIGRKCPYCSGRYAIKGVNDLETINPTLAKEWHPSKNRELSPKDVTSGSSKKVWWMCKKGHEWEATVHKRTGGHNCPVCSNRKLLVGFNDLFTINPELAVEWHPSKNGDLTPQNVTFASTKKVWWKCKNGHEWEASISKRNKGMNCPYCKNKR